MNRQTIYRIVTDYEREEPTLIEVAVPVEWIRPRPYGRTQDEPYIYYSVRQLDEGKHDWTLNPRDAIVLAMVFHQQNSEPRPAQYLQDFIAAGLRTSAMHAGILKKLEQIPVPEPSGNGTPQTETAK